MMLIIRVNKTAMPKLRQVYCIARCIVLYCSVPARTWPFQQKQFTTKFPGKQLAGRNKNARPSATALHRPLLMALMVGFTYQSRDRYTLVDASHTAWTPLAPHAQMDALDTRHASATQTNEVLHNTTCRSSRFRERDLLPSAVLADVASLHVSLENDHKCKHGGSDGLRTRGSCFQFLTSTA